MAGYIHRATGSRVDVSDERVMDPQAWEPVAPVKAAPKRRAKKADADDE